MARKRRTRKKGGVNKIALAIGGVLLLGGGALAWWFKKKSDAQALAASQAAIGATGQAAAAIGQGSMVYPYTSSTEPGLAAQVASATGQATEPLEGLRLQAEKTADVAADRWAPSELTIPIGGSILFRNVDQAKAYNLEIPGIISTTLQPNQSKRVVFKYPGEHKSASTPEIHVTVK